MGRSRWNPILLAAGPAPVVMDLKAIAQNELAKIITAHPNAVVVVVNGANSADGIRDTQRNEAQLADEGEIGGSSGTVRCNADTIGSLTDGQTITVGGAAAFVMEHRLDCMNAIATIVYQRKENI